MSHPFRKPNEITLETLPQLFAHHRARFGGWSMTAGAVEPVQPTTPPVPTVGPLTQPPAVNPYAQPAPPAAVVVPPVAGNPPAARPDGITEEEWSALGDPGKAALVRERSARTQAEQALAAARQPAPVQPPAPPKHAAPAANGPQDIATMVQEAVNAALAPIQETFTHQATQQAVEKLQDAVTAAAADRFNDPSDALTGIDLSTLTDGAGRADPAKVTAALDELLTRKPYLGKVVDNRRQAVPGGLVGANGGAVHTSLEARVQAQLELMNQNR